MLHYWALIISGFSTAWLYKGLRISVWQGMKKIAELDEHQTSNSLMVGVVSSILTGNIFVFCWNILKRLDVNIVQKYQICVTNENSSEILLSYIFICSPARQEPSLPHRFLLPKDTTTKQEISHQPKIVSGFWCGWSHIDTLSLRYQLWKWIIHLTVR